jgi:hypothetical protein
VKKDTFINKTQGGDEGETRTACSPPTRINQDDTRADADEQPSAGLAQKRRQKINKFLRARQHPSAKTKEKKRTRSLASSSSCACFPSVPGCCFLCPSSCPRVALSPTFLGGVSRLKSRCL